MTASSNESLRAFGPLPADMLHFRKPLNDAEFIAARTSTPAPRSATRVHPQTIAGLERS